MASTLKIRVEAKGLTIIRQLSTMANAQINAQAKITWTSKGFLCWQTINLTRNDTSQINNNFKPWISLLVMTQGWPSFNAVYEVKLVTQMHCPVVLLRSSQQTWPLNGLTIRSPCQGSNHPLLSLKSSLFAFLLLLYQLTRYQG